MESIIENAEDQRARSASDEQKQKESLLQAIDENQAYDATE